MPASAVTSLPLAAPSLPVPTERGCGADGSTTVPKVMVRADTLKPWHFKKSATVRSYIPYYPFDEVAVDLVDLQDLSQPQRMSQTTAVTTHIPVLCMKSVAFVCGCKAQCLNSLNTNSAPHQ